MKAKIEIDKKSGCCFGVANAISRAEKELNNGETLYCLGDIVHNNVEVERLSKLGMQTINHEEFAQLHNVKVLLRAHGEPPETYAIAKKNNIELIDATCPVVLRLQRQIFKKYDESKENESQIVIYGKRGHAEVNGLMGQTNSNAIIIEKKEDLEKIDFSKGVSLFSQTTKPLEGFRDIIQTIGTNIDSKAEFEYHDTICRQVSNRVPEIKLFAQKHDVIFFVAGKKSSNGRVLFEECRGYNKNTFFISTAEEIDTSILNDEVTIGICGATSTPMWQMEDVAKSIDEYIRGNSSL